MWRVGWLLLFTTVIYGQAPPNPQVTPPTGADIQAPNTVQPAPPPTTEPPRIIIQRVDRSNADVQSVITQPQMCSIPLQSIKKPSDGAIRQITPREIDPKIVLKPAAPTCARTFNQPLMTWRPVPKF